MTPTVNLEAGAGDLVAEFLEREADLRDMAPDEYDENVTANMRKASVLLREAAAQLAAVTAENARLREALEFYADPRSYHGPNQRADEGEKHTVGSYRKDVTRDGGDIARAALSQEAPK